MSEPGPETDGIPPGPQPAPPDPLPADDGAARQKVLIGGVACLFALTLAGLVYALVNSRKPPAVEPIYVPSPAESRPAPDTKK